MTKTSQALKVICSWVSIVYVVCFGGVALVPGMRAWFMEYALHTRIDTGTDVMTLATFISGLVVWNIIAILAVWLYVALNNYFK
ncbi:MAG: DUF5676 family membrane protein [Patescibacteria group bacterium]